MSNLIKKDFGHIIVYGDTNSGKTYYTKYLINKIKPKKVWVYAGVLDQWNDFYSEGVYDTFENIKEIIEYCKMNKEKVKRQNKFIIVFDDFNKRINTQTNQDYISLFTEGRHQGIRIINLAHHVQDVGPVVRNNARFIVFTQLPNDELKRIAETYYDSKYSEILQLFHESKQYSVGVLDKRLKELVLDIAEEENNEEDKEVYLDSEKNKIYEERPEIAPINVSPIQHEIFTGSRIGGTKIAGNNFLDQSNNVFNTAIKNEDKINVVNTNHIINLTKIKNDYICQRLKDSEETRYLIRKAWKNDEDIKKIIHTLNNELKPKIPFNLCNYEDGCIIFMHKFYGENYNPSESIVDTVGTLYESRNNPVNLLTIGYNFSKKILQ